MSHSVCACMCLCVNLFTVHTCMCLCVNLFTVHTCAYESEFLLCIQAYVCKKKLQSGQANSRKETFLTSRFCSLTKLHFKFKTKLTFVRSPNVRLFDCLKSCTVTSSSSAQEKRSRMIIRWDGNEAQCTGGMIMRRTAQLG